MTGSKIVLDTSIVIAWLKGDQIIADKIDKADTAYIPVFVLGELYYGAQYSLNVQTNLATINKIAENYELLNTNIETAFFYGALKAQLRKKGKPIPENDIWIASITQQHQLILISRDKHFDEIDGLFVESWLS